MSTSKRLHARLNKLAPNLNLPTGRQRDKAGMPSIENFIKDGLDPVHAAYAFIQNITSLFSETVSQMPKMRKFADLVTAPEDFYIPSGPPISPLTGSFFTTWAFYDLRFDGTDTIGTCLIDSN